MARRALPERLRTTAVFAAGAALVAALASDGARVGAETPPPILFQDLSALSGGPVDFGTPQSTLEKCACVFFDADGDGWDDIVTLTGQDEPFVYLLNRDDGAGGRTFVPAPPGHGLDEGACLVRDGSTIAAADVDQDGDQDLYVGFSWTSGFQPGEGQNALLLNDGTGRFAEVTEEAGLLDGDNTTCAACFFDFDLDGDLDLFTCNTDFPPALKEGDGRAHLWRNELKETGTLRFAEETEARGVVEEGAAVWCATGTDHDGDGDFDLLVGHDIEGKTQLFRNDGTGHFTDVTAESGSGAGDDDDPSTFGDDSYAAMGITWGDYDNDGDDDLYLSNVAKNPLYRNNGDGTFTELGKTAGVRASYVTWGVSFADFDLDGHVDLYVAGGDVWNATRPSIRTYLYRNLADGTFADVTATANLRRDVPLHREGGTAIADFDRDGRPDLLVTRSERSGASPYLYRNVSDTAGRRWLQTSLRGNGRTTNRDAIGAKIRVVPRDAAGAALPGLLQFREINGGDSRGSRSSLAPSMGLGPDAVTADVTVVWPLAGTAEERTRTWLDVPLDRLIVLSEDPREATWRLDPDAAVPVAAGFTTSLAAAGTGAPDPLTRIVLESGPAWAALGPHDADGVRTIVVSPPEEAVGTSAEIVLVATAQGAADPESRQTLRLTVEPAPKLAAARRSGRIVTVRGLQLDRPGLVVRVDGAAIVPFKLGPKLLRLRIPARASRTWARKKDHVVEVRDPATGAVATLRIRR